MEKEWKQQTEPLPSLIGEAALFSICLLPEFSEFPVPSNIINDHPAGDFISFTFFFRINVATAPEQL